MTAPAFTTVERVQESLGIGPYDTVDDAWLALVVDAVNVAICQWRPDLHWQHCLSCDYGQASPGQFSPADYNVAQYVTGAGTRNGRLRHYGRGCGCGCHVGGGIYGGRSGQFVGTDFVWGEYVTGGDGTSTGDPRWYYLGDARVALGATILAQRWYKRRGADEVAAFTEFGGSPPTVDKDVENLLQINRSFRPVVA